MPILSTIKSQRHRSCHSELVLLGCKYGRYKHQTWWQYHKLASWWILNFYKNRFFQVLCVVEYNRPNFFVYYVNPNQSNWKHTFKCISNVPWFSCGTLKWSDGDYSELVVQRCGAPLSLYSTTSKLINYIVIKVSELLEV